MVLDYIIVGQGLAGTMLANELMKREKKFIIYDEFDPASASNVATGLINPVICRNLNQFWKAELFLDYATNSYQELERLIKSEFYHPMEMIRIFKDEEEKEKLQKRLKNKPNPFIGKIVDDLPDGVNTEAGGILIERAAFLDIRKLVNNMRVYLRDGGILLEDPFVYTDLDTSLDVLNYDGWRTRKIIFAEGYGALNNPFFKELPFACTKGELINIETEALSQDQILNLGYNLLPIGNNRFKYGATYNWDDLTPSRSEEARNILVQKLKNWLNIDFKVVDHEAGVRPTVSDRKPLLGTSTEDERIALFNGMGSHGGILAPWMATHLLDHLEKGTNLMPEADIKRDAEGHGS